MILADPTKLNDFAFIGDGSRFVTVSDDKLARVWDLTGKQVAELAGSGGPLGSVAVRPDGLQLAAGGAENKVFVWTLADGKLAATLETPAVVSRLQYTADGTKLLAGGADKHLRAFDAVDYRLLDDTTVAMPVTVLAAVPESRSIVTLAAGNNAAVYETPLLALLTGHEGAVTDIAYTPDGTQFLSGGEDGTVRLWSAAQRKVTRPSMR